MSLINEEIARQRIVEINRRTVARTTIMPVGRHRRTRLVRTLRSGPAARRAARR